MPDASRIGPSLRVHVVPELHRHRLATYVAWGRKREHPRERPSLQPPARPVGCIGLSCGLLMRVLNLPNARTNPLHVLPVLPPIDHL